MLKRFLSFRFIAGSLLLIGFIVAYWQWLAYHQFLNSPITWENSNKFLVVEKGNGLSQLAHRWEEDGVISSSFYLRLFGRLNPEFKKIKVGEYRIEQQETPLSLITKLVEGKVVLYSFTIVEGVNSHQLLDLLSKDKNLNFDVSSDKLLSQLSIDASNIEGWFYPDTYHFSKGSSALELLQRALKTMQNVLLEEWENRALVLPYQSPYEALIMASIIEKETGVASEREQIAGVFVRRLQKKMRLQTDPTVIYGIGPEFNGDITYKDLRTATPYNTYVIKGLPPTPIAMPGRAAIHAALHPAEGEALYFVATGDGGHYFSATLEEHNRAVKRYLRKQ